MGSGLQQFNYASNVFYLFVPVTAQSIEDAHIITSLFPPNASRHVQGSELERLELMEIILIPNEGFSALIQRRSLLNLKASNHFVLVPSYMKPCK